MDGWMDGWMRLNKMCYHIFLTKEKKLRVIEKVKVVVEVKLS